LGRWWRVSGKVAQMEQRRGGLKQWIQMVLYRMI
jgi:hypothetical protein